MWTCGPWTLADQGIQWGWEAGRGFQGHTWLPPSGFSQGSRSQHEGSKQGTRAPPPPPGWGPGRGAGSTWRAVACVPPGDRRGWEAKCKMETLGHAWRQPALSPSSLTRACLPAGAPVSTAAETSAARTSPRPGHRPRSPAERGPVRVVLLCFLTFLFAQ